MALGFSGSKGGIKRKSKLEKSKYIDIFKKLTKNERSNRVLDKTKTF